MVEEMAIPTKALNGDKAPQKPPKGSFWSLRAKHVKHSTQMAAGHFSGVHFTWNTETARRAVPLLAVKAVP